jgi:hypothetical protein
MRYVLGFLCVCALGLMPLVGCSETSGPGGSGGAAGTGGGGAGGTGGADLCKGIECDDANECTSNECDPLDGSCTNTPIDDGAFCDAGYCQSGQCEPIASIFPCSEQGIRDAIAEGGGPHGFACEGPTVVTTTAEIVIDHDVILDGRDDLMVDGNDDHVVFAIPADVEAELRRITVSGGFTPGSLEGSGGGIANEGTLKMTRCTVSRNSAGETGSAGIWNGRFASLMLTNSAVSENTGGQVGFGGIWNRGTLTISNSAMSGNSAGDFGVNGVMNDGPSATLTVANSTVSENTGGKFGGILNNGGTLRLTNSTVSGNAGESSGGIFNGDGTLTLTNSTLSENTAESGAGIVNVVSPVSAVLIIVSSLVDDDCIGWREGLPQGSPDIISGGYNIESPGDTCGFDQTGDQVNVSPDDLKLGELADNGGPTMTRALLPGSVAIDLIPEADCVDADGKPLTTDQRGVTRPQGAACDVGALEMEVAP